MKQVIAEIIGTVVGVVVVLATCIACVQVGMILERQRIVNNYDAYINKAIILEKPIVQHSFSTIMGDLNQNIIDYVFNKEN